MNVKSINRKNRHLHSEVIFCLQRVLDLCELGHEASIDERRIELDCQLEREVVGKKNVEELRERLHNTAKQVKSRC